MYRRYFKKEYVFISAIIILLITCYQFAFKETISAWQLNKQLRYQLQQSSDVSMQPGYIERKNANLSRILDLYKADTLDFRNNAISKISSVAETDNVKLAEAPTRDPIYSNGQFFIQRLDLEGDYFSLMKVFDRLGQIKDAGIVRSVVFKQKRDRKKEKGKDLVMELYFEVLNR